MLNKYIMFFKLKNNRLNKRNFNIDQNNRDYDSVHYRAALRCLYNRNNAVTSTGVVLTVAFDEDGERWRNLRESSRGAFLTRLSPRSNRVYSLHSE